MNRRLKAVLMEAEILFSCATLLKMLPSSTFLTSCFPVQIPLRDTHSPFADIIYDRVVNFVNKGCVGLPGSGH